MCCGVEDSSLVFTTNLATKFVRREIIQDLMTYEIVSNTKK